MIQTKSDGFTSQFAMIVLTGLVIALIFAFISLILPNANDDVSWAQGLREVPHFSQKLGNNFLRILPIVTIINLLVWSYCKLRHIPYLMQVTTTMTIASVGALLFSLFPIADGIVWTIIIKFHLKRQDHLFDLILALLSSGVTIGVGIMIGILFCSLQSLAIRGNA